VSEYIFKLPDLGEGTVESEIGEWFINVGDQVVEEDVVATMMTEKAAVELASPVSGKVVSLAGDPGDVIAVGAPLIVFATNGAGANAQARASARVEPGRTVKEQTTTTANDTVRRSKAVTSPAIRRMAREAGIDLALVPGSGAGGRILRSDFEQYLAKQPSMDAAVTARPASIAKEIKVIGLRRVIAERMSSANREIPHFSYVEEVDISELESLRNHLNDRKSGNGEHLTLLPFISLALVRALEAYPQCNTTYDKERNVLLRHYAVHLGIATQTPDGLKVPVVRNCEGRSLESLAADIRRVSDAARNNTIRKDELTGSTITITSLGKLGGIVSTPIINLPEVAIIGINRAVDRPVVIDGQVSVRLMMNLSSSFDHRFVDGYDAAAMIQNVKEMLEYPATIFMTN
jgi:2-oxoisovalerate dehydrogenase E2 component (dihydrolipoyl transacylase)